MEDIIKNTDIGAKVSCPSVRLQQALKHNGMKQIDLANSSGINKSNISCYVSGKYEPKPDVLFKFAKALHVNEMWLAGYDVPMMQELSHESNGQFDELTNKTKNNLALLNLCVKISKLPQDCIPLLEQLVDKMMT